MNLCIMLRGFEIGRQALFRKDRCELGHAGAAGCGGGRNWEGNKGRWGKNKEILWLLSCFAERLALWAFTPCSKRDRFVSSHWHDLPNSCGFLWVWLILTHPRILPRAVYIVFSPVCMWWLHHKTHISQCRFVSPQSRLLSIPSRCLRPRQEWGWSRVDGTNSSAVCCFNNLKDQHLSSSMH